MKIVSWNVNGLRACMEKGFVDAIIGMDADICCIQETKASRQQAQLNIEGYQQFWYSSRRSGYSGVLTLTRQEPISVRYGFGNGMDKFDIEGRLTTLEFEDFILLNTYMPLSKSRLQRSEYRQEWDDTLLEYIKTLTKPVIICGDFNVAHSYIDIYQENLRNEEFPSGFKEAERANFDRLLNYGFIDAFRHFNPGKREYSWWSNRGKKREENRGWRLDYFLVHNSIFPKVSGTKILGTILGSDHCPIELTLDLVISKSTARENEIFAQQWDAIDWNRYETELFEKQKELANAVKYRDRTLAFEIQNEILSMPAAKALAVRHVANSSSEAGVDGIRWVTSAEKKRASLNLDENNFSPSPLKSVVIYDGHKDRRINIPTYQDRAIQTLIRFALEPYAETTGDRKSFGFRKGRSAFDAMTYLKLTMEQCPDLYVFRGDVKSYYDTISHQWIFDHLPMRQSMKKLLKSGVLVNGELFPSDAGISQGSGLSPIVGNMVLDGLQVRVHRALYPNQDPENYAYGDLVRFADDFVFFAKDYEQAVQIQQIVVEFLVERGLRLSPEKSYIVPASEGFDFLGWRFRQLGKAALITPSERGVKDFESRMEQKILSHNGSVEELIRSINKSIYGYANYHRVVESYDIFRHLDVVIQALLAQKVRELHPKRPWKQVREMYWYINSQGEAVFTAPEQRHLQVLQMKRVTQSFYFAVKTTFNYFLDRDYLKQIENQRKIDRHIGSYNKLWESQEGCCFLCGRPMLPDQFLKIVKFPNIGMVYIHSRCRETALEFHQSDNSDEDGVDVASILSDITNPILEVDTYLGLSEFFCKEDRQVFTLSFEEISELLGEPLPAQSDCEHFWHDTTPQAISHCWLRNGYIIQRLDLKYQKVIFRKDNHSLTSFSIPKALTTKKIPKNAQDEIDAFLRYIIKKYKLY